MSNFGRSWGHSANRWRKAGDCGGYETGCHYGPSAAGGRCANFAASRVEFHAISAATGEGVRELVRSIADALDKITQARRTRGR